MRLGQSKDVSRFQTKPKPVVATFGASDLVGKTKHFLFELFRDYFIVATFNKLKRLWNLVANDNCTWTAIYLAGCFYFYDFAEPCRIWKINLLDSHFRRSKENSYEIDEKWNK